MARLGEAHGRAAEQERPHHLRTLTAELHPLGLIATQRGAAEALEQLTPSGLKIDVHRKLDMLWINAALDDAA